MESTLKNISVANQGESGHEGRDLILFHMGFVLVGLMAYWAAGASPGHAIFLFLMSYNIGSLTLSIALGHQAWLRAWSLTLLLSLMLIASELFLVNEFASVVFTDSGFPEVGRVPLFMLLIWTLPLTIIVMLGRQLAKVLPRSLTYLGVALLSAIVFGIADLLPSRIAIWYPQHVLAFGNVAAYALCARIVLGVATYSAWRITRYLNPFWLPVAAVAVMLTYTGALAFFYFVFERLLVL